MPTNPPAHPGTTDTSTTTGTPAAPAAPLAPNAPLNNAAPLRQNTTPNNTTRPQNQADTAHNNTIGPQDGTCTPRNGTWGPPANDALVRRVPNRDRSTVQWDIDTQCTLTIHHGTTPDYGGYSYSIPWYSYQSTITKIRIDGNLTLHNTSGSYIGLFEDMGALREVRIDGTLHLSQKAAYALFRYDSALTAFTGRGTAAIETSQTTDMSGMFAYCSGLTALDVTHLDTTNTTNMGSMFRVCSGLTALDVTHFNTTNTTNMNRMFVGCSGLTALDVTHFNTTNVHDMTDMFAGCSGLTALDVTHFNTTNVHDMSGMFAGCSGLTALDLSSFDTRTALNVTGTYAGVEYMLNYNPGLRELWLGPHTHLTKTGTEPNTDYRNAFGDTPYDAWVEVPTSGPRIPVADMRARTALDTRTNPTGHYVIPTLTLTIDYNNAQPDHTQTVTIRTANPGTRPIDWSWRYPAPAGKAFDRWDITAGDPTHLSTTGNTVTWTSIMDNSAATITARWRTLPQPAITLNVHADGTTDPWGGTGPWAEISAEVGAGDWRAGDTIELKSLNGTGATTTCTTRTCTARLTIAQLRDNADWDAPYLLTATLTARDIPTDTAGTAIGDPADKQGILPYTTVNYHTGNGASGTPPATAKALTDTDSRTAQLTVAGPSPIARPAHNLFAAWQAAHAGGAPGTARPGLSPVPTGLGDTDAQGRTAVELTAQWTALDAPAVTGATREQTTNKATVTGTAKPAARGTAIHICHPDTTGARQCHDTTPDDTDANGNTLPYDGTTEHPWTITLPPDAPMDQYTADATTTATDPAYPAGSDQVESPAAHIQVPPLDQHTLPLTGGNNRRTLPLAATALAAAMLLTAAANTLRNRRHRKARHRDTATAKTGRH